MTVLSPLSKRYYRFFSPLSSHKISGFHLFFARLNSKVCNFCFLTSPPSSSRSNSSNEGVKNGFSYKTLVFALQILTWFFYHVSKFFYRVSIANLGGDLRRSGEGLPQFVYSTIEDLNFSWGWRWREVKHTSKIQAFDWYIPTISQVWYMNPNIVWLELLRTHSWSYALYSYTFVS